MDILRLEARGGVGHAQAVRHHVAVERARMSADGDEFVPALRLARHMDRVAPVDLDRNLVFARRPETEAHAVLVQFRPMRHCMRAFCHGQLLLSLGWPKASTERPVTV
jgi:hypothetical protein